MRSWGRSNPPLFLFFPRSPLQEVVSLRNPITLLSGSLRLLSVAEDYLLLLLSPILCLPPGWNCKVSTWRVAKAPNLTPEVGMRTGLCRSGTKVYVGGQELFLSLKMCALGSAPCTERKEHGPTNILPPRAVPPHSGSMPLAWFSVPYSRMLSRFPWAIHCLASAFLS